jgi:transposase
MQNAEVARLRRQEQLELFQTIHQLKATGMRVIEITRHLGLNRRRIDRWLRLDTLPERNQIEPRPGMVEWFRDYLQQRWTPVVSMAERFSPRSRHSATSVPSRISQGSFHLGVSRHP